MTALPYLCAIKASGEDTRHFLQAQLAADISELKSGQSGFSAYCNAKGQVIALTLVICRDSDFLIICENGLAQKLLSRFEMFVLRAKVNFEMQPKLEIIGIKPGDKETSDLQLYQPAKSSLIYALGSSSLSGALTSDWRKHELSHGVCWLNPETSERFLPQMLGFDSIAAVSFSKGCYPGQEIIARTRYLGKLKRRPLLLEIMGQPDYVHGETWLVNGQDTTVDATMIDCITVNSVTAALLVAPIQENEKVDSVEVQNVCYPANRVYPVI